MDEIFVDSDIILDLLSSRIPFHRAADKLFTLSDQGNIQLRNVDLITVRYWHGDDPIISLWEEVIESNITVMEKVIEYPHPSMEGLVQNTDGNLESRLQISGSFFN